MNELNITVYSYFQYIFYIFNNFCDTLNITENKFEKNCSWSKIY